jgi:hypothetical protein
MSTEERKADELAAETSAASAPEPQKSAPKRPKGHVVMPHGVHPAPKPGTVRPKGHVVFPHGAPPAPKPGTVRKKGHVVLPDHNKAG